MTCSSCSLCRGGRVQGIRFHSTMRCRLDEGHGDTHVLELVPRRSSSVNGIPGTIEREVTGTFMSLSDLTMQHTKEHQQKLHYLEILHTEQLSWVRPHPFDGKARCGRQLCKLI